MIVLLIASIVWLVLATGLEYRISASGLARRTRFGTTTLLWDQLDQVRFRAISGGAMPPSAGTYVTSWLRDVRGQRLTILSGDNYYGYLLVAPSDVEDLQRAVLELSTPPLCARLRARLDAGEEVTLGDVIVSPAGLLTGQGKIAWESLRGFGTHAGHLYFFSRNPEEPVLAARVADVVNVQPLLELLGGFGVGAVPMEAGFLGPRVVGNRSRSS